MRIWAFTSSTEPALVKTIKSPVASSFEPKQARGEAT